MKMATLEPKSNAEPWFIAFLIPRGIQTRYDKNIPVKPSNNDILNLGAITSVTGFA